MKTKMLLGLFALFIGGGIIAQEKPKLMKYGVDPARIKNGEYRGRFAPDADYVLSGQLRKDFGPLPKVPFYYVKDSEGYDPSAISKVPPPGVHPRVLMSPEDIVRIRKEVQKGDKADRYFRIVWNELKNDKGAECTGLVALVEQDEKVGKETAAKLVEHALYLEPAVELMNTHPEMKDIRDYWFSLSRSCVMKVGGEYYKDVYAKGGGDLVRKMAKKSVEFSSAWDRQSSGNLCSSYLQAYDYLYPFMSEEQRNIVRRVIAKATAGKYTSGMGIPGHMFINNHMSMGEDILMKALAIEGEEGYDPRLLREYSKSVRDKITYDISEQGLMYEKLKGLVPEQATWAITRRANDPGTGALPLMRHSHLRAFMWAKALDAINIYNNPCIYNTPGYGDKIDYQNRKRVWWQGFGSGPSGDQYFGWGFVLRMVYPKDPMVDFFYKDRLMTFGFGSVRDTGPLPKPRMRSGSRPLMILGACDGLRNDKGQPIDYNKDGLPKKISEKKKAFVDLPRGVAVSRSSWDKDAMTIHYECRSDAYVTGHEGPEAQDFNLSSLGVIWSQRKEWYLDPYFRNMILINGKAGSLGPSAAKLMKVVDNNNATTFISDATNHYNWSQGGKCFDDWHNMYKQAEMHIGGMRSSGGLFRGTEVAPLKHMREYNEGFAGLDWGGWHGEERGVSFYHRYNDIDHIFRALHLTKGKNPYVLVIDDVRKDDKVNQYDWCFHVENDVTLYTADGSVKGMYSDWAGGQVPVPGGGGGTNDFILCQRDVKESRDHQFKTDFVRKPKKGDSMLLIRVLHREAAWPFPQPAFETGMMKGGKRTASRVRVPSLSVDPKFRIMIYPFRFGDKLPVTKWNDGKTKLTIELGGNKDVYTFAQTDRERTVFTYERNGKLMSRSGAPPAAPKFDVSAKWAVDLNHPDALREIVFNGSRDLAFKQVPMGQTIRFTLDGKEPTKDSTIYNGPIKVDKSCTVKAKVFARYWPYGKPESKTTAVKMIQRDLAPAVTPDSRPLTPGLACKVFEKHFTFYGEKTGMFTGKKNMVPKLTEKEKLVKCLVPGFNIPQVLGKLSKVEQANGYYKFTGFIKVAKDGVYNFELDSCGPVVFDVSGQKVIHQTGCYGTSQRKRYGQAALKAGLHPVDLFVADPMFWKIESIGAYPFTVKVMEPGSSKYIGLSNSQLFTAEKGLKPIPEPVIPVAKAVKPGNNLETGLVLNCYDRTDKYSRRVPKDGVPVDFFKIEGQKPYLTKPVMSINASGTAGRLAVYTGFLEADRDGVYEFEMDTSGANQLIIDDVLVAQNKTKGKVPIGKVKLNKGSHKFDMRLAGSKGILRIKAPGEKNLAPADIGLFLRPTGVKARDDGRLMLHLDGEKMDDNNMLVHKFSPITAKLRKGKLVDNGLDGKGMKIQGDDSWIEIEGLRTAEDAFSLAFWVRFDEARDRWLINGHWGSHPDGRIRGYRIGVGFYRLPGASFDMRKVGAQKKKFHQVVITYGAAVKLYVDGKLRDWNTKTDPSRNAFVEKIKLFENQIYTVDEIGLYNKVLSAEEVKALYDKFKDKAGK